MASLSVHLTEPFLRAFEKVKSRNTFASQASRFKALLRDLAANERPLARKWCDHPLKGRMKHCRAAHVSPDLVLLYVLTDTTIEILDIGTHREVYGIE